VNAMKELIELLERAKSLAATCEMDEARRRSIFEPLNLALLNAQASDVGHAAWVKSTLDAALADSRDSAE
jgi:hypothetical protein